MIRIEKITPEIVKKLCQDIFIDFTDHVHLPESTLYYKPSSIYLLKNLDLPLDTNISKIYSLELRDHHVVFYSEDMPYSSIID